MIESKSFDGVYARKKVDGIRVSKTGRGLGFQLPFGKMKLNGYWELSMSSNGRKEGSYEAEIR